MIVCKRCGNHNPVGDDFCGSCGAFLEWEGERIIEDVVEQPTAEALPPPAGLVTRIKHAVLGDDTALAPPAAVGGAPTPGSPLAAPTLPAPSPTLAPLAAAPSLASALVAKQPVASSEPTPRQPSAQAPTAAVARPKPQVKQPPTRTINPGDLVCGTCGEPNSADRNFCRRCGATLAEVVAVKQRWWKRKPNTKKAAKNAPAQAGERPMAAGGKAGALSGGKKGARKVKTGIFGGFNNVRRVIAILAIVGIGTGLAVPGLRSTIMNKGSDIFNSVKRKISPSYLQVSPDNSLSTASSADPGHEATMIADGLKNTFWIGAASQIEETVTVVFSPPTILAKILITSGNQELKENFKAEARPKDIFVTAFDTAGATVKTLQITLDDKADPQKFDLEGKDVASVSVAVQSCYPVPGLHVCAISELEFFKEK